MIYHRGSSLTGVRSRTVSQMSSALGSSSSGDIFRRSSAIASVMVIVGFGVVRDRIT